ncbi:ATP-binding protein [Alkalicoccobacillus gibsonii]|uniref:ATP-binding protein n=1 Tax=Alkalicoccobacillus gibsonii TaxID=79881 RepID=UPI003F7C6DAC
MTSRLPQISDNRCPDCSRYMIIKEDEETCGYCTTIKAEDEQIGIAAREEQERREQMKALRVFDQESIINDRLKNVSFETYEPSNKSQAEALHAMKGYVARFTKDNPVPIILMGSYGLGKSHLAAATTKALAEKNIKSIFISVPKLITKIKSTWDKQSDVTESEILTALEKVDCLVLDDIGAEQTKRSKDGEVSWGVTKLFEIIDSRIGKHTIFTTNLGPNELQNHLGPRNFSRMMEGVHVMKLTGEDYRLRQFKEA